MDKIIKMLEGERAKSIDKRYNDDLDRALEILKTDNVFKLRKDETGVVRSISLSEPIKKWKAYFKTKLFSTWLYKFKALKHIIGVAELQKDFMDPLQAKSEIIFIMRANLFDYKIVAKERDYSSEVVCTLSEKDKEQYDMELYAGEISYEAWIKIMNEIISRELTAFSNINPMFLVKPKFKKGVAEEAFKGKQLITTGDCDINVISPSGEILGQISQEEVDKFISQMNDPNYSAEDIKRMHSDPRQNASALLDAEEGEKDE